MTSITLPISNGEALDKLSILDIKMGKIQNHERNIAVKQEYDLIYPLLKNIIDNHKYHYKCLKWINTLIWNLSDDIRNLGLQNCKDQKYVDLYVKLLATNEERFRIKNKINLLSNSLIKEQKKL